MRSFISSCLVLIVGCSPAPNGNDAGSDAAADAPKGPLPFTPSNFTLDGMDLSKIKDEDVTGNCEVRTAEGDSQDCFVNAFDTTVVQSDGSKLRVFVMKSLRVEPTAHMWFHGGLPVAVVALGNIDMLGTIDGHATNETPGPGGFRALGNTKGAGPCGGAGATGVTGTAGAGAGGGSNCGIGGQGNAEVGSSTQPGPKTPACGTPSLVPLVGGSSGGGGDIGGGGGGGAIQLVAGGTFTTSASSWINVGGGGGDLGGTKGQESGGGGAGGALLVEATSAKIAGAIAANGGGGGGGGTAANVGGDGTPDAVAAKGGPGTAVGGDGAASTSIDGMSAAALSVASSASSGGGGAGRIRINTLSGAADLGGSVVSPATTTSCVTQGTVQ